jgi:hypothetical protein
MKITLQVTPTEGEPYQVTTTMKVIIDWERKYKKSVNELAAGRYTLEDIVFFAYQAAKASGVPVPMTLDGFIDKIEQVEVVEVEDGNPTNGDSTAGASPSS